MEVIDVVGDNGSSEVGAQENRRGHLLLVSGQYTCNKEIKAAVTVPKCFSYRVQKIESKESFVQRRVSLRLQKINESERPYYGSSPKKSLEKPEGEISRKKAKVTYEKQESLPNTYKDKDGPKDWINGSNAVADTVNIRCSGSKNVGLKGHEEKAIVSKVPAKSVSCSSSPAKSVGACSSAIKFVDKGIYAKVKETLRIFNTHYLHFVQEEEKRCKKVDLDDTNARCSKPQNGDACEADPKRLSKRADLKAMSKMLESNEVLYPKKRFGHLPGIDVGHHFFSRVEMVAVGLHGHWLNGIDFMGNSYAKLEEYNGHTFPLAVAIVLSGQYEDDLDNSEDVLYTGQGGNDLLGNKRQVKDQVMRRGNLALKNNMEQSMPVRVIRGHVSSNSYCGKVYTYDGLYEVVQYWAEKGVSGFTVFKYRLKRLGGQPVLTTNQVHFARGRVFNVPSELPGLVCTDICQGQEDICVPATNLFDDPPTAPAGFTYSRSIQVAANVKLPLVSPGCKCKGSCTNPQACSCAQLNGSDFPYVRKNGGRLIEPQDVVFECGPNCGCGPDCVNRTSQRGLKYRLEVFRTANKGWAVRSWDSIPSGAPVCEYIGVLRRTDELDNVSGNEFIFEIDCWQTIKEIGGRERRLRDVSVSVPTNNYLEKLDDKVLESTPEFCLDAGSTGNVARFINHSCEPNLFVQCVLSSHHDIRLARIVLFAADNIPPLQELTYDYGYALGSVVGPDGKIKEMPCYCGAANCRKRLY